MAFYFLPKVTYVSFVRDIVNCGVSQLDEYLFITNITSNEELE